VADRDRGGLLGRRRIEVVAVPGWASGNAMTLLLSNAATAEDGSKYEGSRSLTGYDPDRGPGYLPVLAVRWAVP
jgi:hypothetical protein